MDPNNANPPDDAEPTEVGAPHVGPAASLDRLREGNARFVSGRPRERSWLEEVQATAEGQNPFAFVLGCIDSRVPVEVVFDQGVGDLFTARVAGNARLESARPTQRCAAGVPNPCALCVGCAWRLAGDPCHPFDAIDVPMWKPCLEPSKVGIAGNPIR